MGMGRRGGQLHRASQGARCSLAAVLEGEQAVPLPSVRQEAKTLVPGTFPLSQWTRPACPLTTLAAPSPKPSLVPMRVRAVASPQDLAPVTATLGAVSPLCHCSWMLRCSPGASTV